MPSNNAAAFVTRKILLVRHGRTDWNDLHKFQGRTDIPLNEAGEAQAEKTAARLRGWPIDAVYTSPLARASRTAGIIAARHGKEPIVMPDLTELNFGSWEGASFTKLLEKKDPALLKWIADPFFSPPPGAEDWDSVKGRSRRVADAVAEAGHKHAVIVCHGGIMRGLLAVFLGLDPHTVWRLKSWNCSLTGIEVREHETSLAFANDVLHLKEKCADDTIPVW